MKSILTEYTELSAFSPRPKEHDHHLIYGNGLKELADEDGLILPLCADEHNVCRDGDRTKLIHGNPAAGHLSKMLGQVAWEEYYTAKLFAKKYELTGTTEDEYARAVMREAREAFRRRYGISYL